MLKYLFFSTFIFLSGCDTALSLELKRIESFSGINISNEYIEVFRDEKWTSPNGDGFKTIVLKKTGNIDYSCADHGQIFMTIEELPRHANRLANKFLISDEPACLIIEEDTSGYEFVLTQGHTLVYSVLVH